MPRQRLAGLGAGLVPVLMLTGMSFPQGEANALRTAGPQAATSAPKPTTETDAPLPPPASFGACPADIADPYPAMRCARVDVPMDYANPTGEQVSLLVSKLPARDPAKRRGSLLVNPGGPGGPGVSFAGKLNGDLPAAVRDHYDLIGFDTRHTAHSTPISCVNAEQYWEQPLPDPDSPADRAKNWQRAQDYANGCQQRAGKYLPHLNTRNNARDMDQIRQALGERQISYLGYSYGTYLGAVYGEMFGANVDRMVLDSSVDPSPRNVWYRTNLNQDIAAEHRLDRYFAWIAAHEDTFHLGNTREQVRTQWQRVQDALRAQPHGRLGPSEFIDTTFNALYGESQWTQLAHALRKFNTGNDRPLIDLVEPKDQEAENQNAIYNAVECADAPWPQRRATWEHDSSQIAQHHPLAAWYNSWTVAPCQSWPAPAQQPTRITGRDLPPVLMFNSVHDVATPYDGAQRMHRSLPSSVLVTERDAGKHGVFAAAGNDRADRIGTDYLVHGRTPPEDISIAGHPKPDPNDPQKSARVTLPTPGQ